MNNAIQNVMKNVMTFCFLSLLYLVVQDEAVAEPIVIRGITKAVHSAVISAPVSARIMEIAVKEGDVVQLDDLLIRLQSRKEKLEQLRRKLIWLDVSQLESCQKREKLSKDLLYSSRKLYKLNSSISKEALQKEQLDYQMVLSERKAMELAEKREELEYQLATEEFELRLVRAPINATVTKIYFHTGERTKVGEPMLELINASQGLFYANIEESIGKHLEKGQSVQLVLGKAAQIKVEGMVSFVSPVVDAASGLMEIMVRFDNPDNNTRPGVSGQLLLH